MPVSSLQQHFAANFDTIEIGNGSLLSAPHPSSNSAAAIAAANAAAAASGSSSSSSSGSASSSNAVKLALELALLSGGNGNPHNNGSNGGGPHGGPHGGPLSGPHGGHDSLGMSSSANLLNGLSSSNGALNDFSSNGPNGGLGGLGGLTGSLEDLKLRRSQNMTECVPVPSSEHVAEIVGRQGCKIKALRAKTNTYIKTPVRGDEPVFVVTGRKEDVGLAKREILSAADHFSQIRASRKNQINSTLAFGQLVANTPGQTTVQVRVPYRVVGLVVGPKGATIKRIQQSTHTYIVTPSRDKEPVFEVTGLPENVDSARKEIEAHIALRTGNGFLGDLIEGGGSNGSGFDNIEGFYDRINGAASPHNSSSILNNDFLSNKTLHQLLDESHTNGINIGSIGGGGSNLNRSHPPATTVWSNGTDSHDSGIGHSPPFDALGPNNFGDALVNNQQNLPESNGTGIWGELNKVLGNLDLNGSGGNTPKNHFLNVGSRSSLDLGSLGSLGVGLTNGTGSSSSSSTTDQVALNHHRPSLDLGVMSSISINNTARNNDITAKSDSPTADIMADHAADSSGGENNESNGEYLSF